MVNQALAHFYREARAHQAAVAADGGGMLTTFFDSKRTEVSYGSAPYGFHAVSAFMSAKRSIHFRKTFAADMAEHRRRSRAARKAAKARKAAR